MTKIIQRLASNMATWFANHGMYTLEDLCWSLDNYLDGENSIWYEK